LTGQDKAIAAADNFPNMPNNQQVKAQFLSLIGRQMGLARTVTEHLVMPSVADQIARIEGLLKDGDIEGWKLHDQLVALRDRLNDELGRQYFYFVRPEHVPMYNGQDLFGQEVASQFPTARDDIEAAGKCLALGRDTATVFHLMRVMEAGLRVIATDMGIPYAPSWESYLKQIEALISAKHGAKSPAWKRKEPFYRDVSGDLAMVKIAWRNPTMHVVRNYSAEEADEVFRSVRAFMRRLANRPQPPKRKKAA